MSAFLINGQSYGWAELNVVIGVRLVEGITAVSFSAKKNKTNNKGRGGKIVSRGRGSEDFEASITLELKEILAIKSTLPPGKNLTDIAGFPIIISWVSDSNPMVTVTLTDCEFLEDNFSAAEGDTSTVVECPLIISGIN